MSKDDHQVWVDIAHKYFGPFQNRHLFVVGSGMGDLEAAILDATSGNATITSLDISWMPILSTAKLVRSQSKNGQDSSVQADGHFIPLMNDCVDLVFCIAVLEHVKNYQIFVGEILRVLKPGGHLFLYYGPNAKIPVDTPSHRQIVTKYLTPENVRCILEPHCDWLKAVWADVVAYRLSNKSFKISGNTPVDLITKTILNLASLPIFRKLSVKLVTFLEANDLQHGIAFVGKKNG